MLALEKIPTMQRSVSLTNSLLVIKNPDNMHTDKGIQALQGDYLCFVVRGRLLVTEKKRRLLVVVDGEWKGLV